MENILWRMASSDLAWMAARQRDLDGLSRRELCAVPFRDARGPVITSKGRKYLKDLEREAKMAGVENAEGERPSVLRRCMQ